MSTVDHGDLSGSRTIEPGAGGADETAGEESQLGPDEYDPTTLDTFYGLLKNERRRRVTRYLDEVSPSTTLSDLAEHIAAVENDKPERALRAQERKRVYIQLYQYHLPAMDKAGVIEFNGARGTVERTPKADHLTELLDAGETASAVDPSQTTTGDLQSSRATRQHSPFPDELAVWSIYYLGLGLVGVGLFVLQVSSPVPALVSGAVAGVLLMAVVSCLLVSAARGSAYRDGVAYGVPSSGATAPSSANDADHDRASTGAGGSSLLDKLECLLPTRTRRPVVERPSSNGPTGGSAD